MILRNIERLEGKKWEIGIIWKKWGYCIIEIEKLGIVELEGQNCNFIELLRKERIFALKKEKLRTWVKMGWFWKKMWFLEKSAASRWFMHGCVRWLILWSDRDRWVARLVWVWLVDSQREWPFIMYRLTDAQRGGSEICFAYLIPTTVFWVELFSVCVRGCVGVCVCV